jgi:hypothetical protein
MQNVKLIHGDEKAPNQSQAFPPLDEASCSASSFWVKMWRWLTNADKRESSANEEAYRELFIREQDRKVKDIMDWFEKASFVEAQNCGYCRDQSKSTNNP